MVAAHVEPAADAHRPGTGRHRRRGVVGQRVGDAVGRSSRQRRVVSPYQSRSCWRTASASASSSAFHASWSPSAPRTVTDTRARPAGAREGLTSLITTRLLIGPAPVPLRTRIGSRCGDAGRVEVETRHAAAARRRRLAEEQRREPRVGGDDDRRGGVPGAVVGAHAVGPQLGDPGSETDGPGGQRRGQLRRQRLHAGGRHRRVARGEHAEHEGERVARGGGAGSSMTPPRNGVKNRCSITSENP